MGRDGMGWDGMEWDGTEWDEMGCFVVRGRYFEIGMLMLTGVTFRGCKLKILMPHTSVFRTYANVFTHRVYMKKQKALS